MPGHTFLYSPPVIAIHDLIASGELGELLFISSSRVNLGLHQSDVSVVWDLAPHDFSILRYWLGETPTHVSATARACIGVRPDVAFIDLEYASGPIAHVELSWLAPSKLRRTTIVGSKKMVVYDDTSQRAGARLRLGRPSAGAEDVRRVPADVPDRRHRVPARGCRRAAFAGAGGFLSSDPDRCASSLLEHRRSGSRPDDGSRRPFACEWQCPGASLVRLGRRVSRNRPAQRRGRGLSRRSVPTEPGCRPVPSTNPRRG